MTTLNIENAIERVETLDPFPVTALRLGEILTDDDFSFEDVVELVEQDAAVASNIMRLANSSTLAGREEITSIREAAIRLGREILLEIAFGAHYRGVVTDADAYALNQSELWFHGAVSAIAARSLRIHLGDPNISPLAVVAALVHDVGKIILNDVAQEEDVQALEELVGRGERSFIEAEREVFGTDHSEVGGLIARHWGFPALVIEAIEQHHALDTSEASPETNVVIVSNVLSKSVGVGLGAAGLDIALDERVGARLGLGPSDVLSLCATVALEARELGAYLPSNQ